MAQNGWVDAILTRSTPRGVVGFLSGPDCQESRAGLQQYELFEISRDLKQFKLPLPGEFEMSLDLNQFELFEARAGLMTLF